MKFIPSHVSFIVNSNSDNCIKICSFFTKLQTKISWLHFYGSQCSNCCLICVSLFANDVDVLSVSRLLLLVGRTVHLPTGQSIIPSLTLIMYMSCGQLALCRYLRLHRNVWEFCPLAKCVLLNAKVKFVFWYFIEFEQQGWSLCTLLDLTMRWGCMSSVSYI